MSVPILVPIGKIAAAAKKSVLILEILCGYLLILIDPTHMKTKSSSLAVSKLILDLEV